MVFDVKLEKAGFALGRWVSDPVKRHLLDEFAYFFKKGRFGTLEKRCLLD